MKQIDVTRQHGTAVPGAQAMPPPSGSGEARTVFASVHGHAQAQLVVATAAQPKVHLWR